MSNRMLFRYFFLLLSPTCYCCLFFFFFFFFFSYCVICKPRWRCHAMPFKSFPMHFQDPQLDTPHRRPTVDLQEHLFTSENQKGCQACSRSLPSPCCHPSGARGTILFTFV